MGLQKKFDYPRIMLAGLVAGFAVAVVVYGVQYAVTQFFPYNVLELGGMRSVDDPVMALFLLYPWAVGFTMAAVYPFFTKLIECRSCKPQMFALMVWLVSGVPQFFVVFSSMAYPVGFYLNNLFGGFLSTVAAAYVIWKMLD
jgi:hypothetical protein